MHARRQFSPGHPWARTRPPRDNCLCTRDRMFPPSRCWEGVPCICKGTAIERFRQRSDNYFPPSFSELSKKKERYRDIPIYLLDLKNQHLSSLDSISMIINIISNWNFKRIFHPTWIIIEFGYSRERKFHPPLYGDLLNPLVQFSARSVVQSSVRRGGRRWGRWGCFWW